MNELSVELNSVDSVGAGQLAISEIFGPTFQGEGSSIGRYCYFLRLAGCNQHCAWCDTSYTWDWTGRNGIKYDPKEEVYKYSVEAVIDELYTKMREDPHGRKRIPLAPSMLVISRDERML